MEPDLILRVLFRWMHVLAAIVAIGGLLFMRFVLLPSSRQVLPVDQAAALSDRIRQRWRGFVLVCIAALLVSGFYNFFVLSLPKGREAKLYHPLFGIKFLAALGVFFIASALVGRSAGFAGMRAAAPKWLLIASILAIAVVMLSGVLKNLPA